MTGKIKYVKWLISRKISPMNSSEVYLQKNNQHPDFVPTGMDATYKKVLQPNALIEINRAAHLLACEDPEDHHWKPGSGYQVSSEYTKIINIINDAYINDEIHLREKNINGSIILTGSITTLIKAVLKGGFCNIPAIMKEFADTQPDENITQQKLINSKELQQKDEEILANATFGAEIKKRLSEASKEGGRSTKNKSNENWKPKLAFALEIAKKNPMKYSAQKLAEITNIQHQLRSKPETFAKKIRENNELQQLIKIKKSTTRNLCPASI